jgi:hypothetical protein
MSWLVLGWAAAYATGVAPVDLPAITGPVPALGDGHLEVNPEGLGPQMPGLHLGDPMADLGLMTMGNTEVANQLSAPGPMPGSPMLPSEHGCQVICMASQLPPEATQAAQNLPPWMQPMAPPPWMTPPPAPWMTPPVAPAPMGLPPGPAAETPPAAPAPPPAAPAPALPPAPGTPPWMAPVPAPAPEPAAALGPGPLPGPAS